MPFKHRGSEGKAPFILKLATTWGVKVETKFHTHTHIKKTNAKTAVY
jgi:hypothetical protein